jgi:hypothetical protein
MTNAPNPTPIPEAQIGPAEKLLDLVLRSGAHLWHNRPGLAAGDTWRPAPRGARPETIVKPGLFVPAAAALYSRLLEIYELNAELFAHFASYALLETEWRDLKVACAALMLVQPKSGQPVRGEDGRVAFLDDDYRAVGEAMLLVYQKKSRRMLTPKAVLRVAELLEVPAIAALNRRAGFAEPAARKPPLGRWKAAARTWLRVRENNPPLLEGLVKAGYKETIKRLARKCGYKPAGPGFFATLGWKQKQSAGGHRAVGLSGLVLQKRERFDGLDEAAICERIASEKLGYKDVVGRLPREVGLTPAIMAAVLPSLSDRDLRMLTPTLESLGLLADAEVRARWEAAVRQATDQRALNVARNVKSRELRETLESAADHAARQAVAEATREREVRVFFLIDKSGSMEGAIEQSKEALSRILAGFPPDKLHVATFDTMGTVLRPKAPSRAAVQHMLRDVRAAGGTVHAAAVWALHSAGVRIPDEAALVVMVVGDEDGEEPEVLAQGFRAAGYRVDALALIVSVAQRRGRTVRGCAAALGVPFSEVSVDQFEDPYQVPRVLTTLLEAPVPAGGPGRSAWVEKVMATPILEKPAL